MARSEERWYSCRCFGEGLLVTKWADEDEFYLSVWGYRYTPKPPWRQRLRQIWKILTQGEPYTDQLVLSSADARLLGAFLSDPPIVERTNHVDTGGDWAGHAGGGGLYPVGGESGGLT